MINLETYDLSRISFGFDFPKYFERFRAEILTDDKGPCPMEIIDFDFSGKSAIETFYFETMLWLNIELLS